MRNLLVNSVHQLRAFLKDSWYVVGANGVIAVASFVLFLAFSRFLTPYEYGQYRFVIVVFTFLTITTLTGMNTSIFRSTSRGEEGAYWWGTQRRVLFALFGSLLLVGFAGYLYWLEHPLWFFVAMGSAAFPFMYCSDSVLFYYYGRNEFAKSAVVKVLLLFVPALVLLFTLWKTRSLEAVLFAHIFAYGLSGALVLWKSKKYRTARPSPDVYEYGNHISFLNIFSTIYRQIDKVVLTTFLGFGPLAIYAFAQSLPDQLRLQSKMVFAWIFPKLAKDSSPPLRVIVPYLALALGASGAGVFVLWFLFPLLIPFLFTTAYSESVHVAQVLALALIFWIPIMVLSAYLEAKKRTKELYFYRIVAPAVGIALYVVLIPLFGLMGAAYAQVIAEGYSLVLLTVLCFRKPSKNNTKQ